MYSMSFELPVCASPERETINFLIYNYNMHKLLIKKLQRLSAVHAPKQNELITNNTLTVL